MFGCQFSFYPLRQPRVSPALDAALAELRDAGLHPIVGAMSTYIEGDENSVFDGLKRAFRAAAARGDTVLVATVSNACPTACEG
jgi:uncharacterized protein YqgV (UPF0045/DUF77 family)